MFEIILYGATDISGFRNRSRSLTGKNPMDRAKSVTYFCMKMGGPTFMIRTMTRNFKLNSDIFWEE
ncbi:hypothetical protein LEP1GSC108_2571 [Leptospira weilii str. UI 13098]|uniref:Uncharacterized protein n=1 Tax=Leptospira weilii str. UI 13098 TaxID=1088542 RepID=M6QAT6_9LEPT|nr:hypothetical protein LEP1GSC108_2571 [Leptospira weilii str. UI 13098]